jgi:hypothetical protein
MSPEQLSAIRNWRSMNHAMHSFTEQQVKEMLEHELANSRRPEFVERLHARYNSLRVQRERIELLGSLV